jgi:hypothetical protein
MKNPQIFLEHNSLGVAEEVIELLNHSRRIDKSFLDSLDVVDVVMKLLDRARSDKFFLSTDSSEVVEEVMKLLSR